MDEDTLRWQDDEGFSGSLPLREVCILCLKYEPTRFTLDRYLLKIESPGHEITLSNRSYVRITDFRPVEWAYRGFAVALTHMP
ncbi:MAG: hypothetical protein K9K86_11160 [Pseudomonadales bacterium]|nr:hypothetical protein [Pseudomonadales bacterium]